MVFRDVSLASGMKRPYGRRVKFGGAAIADLDGDGHQDLLFNHHDQRECDAYFNRGDGTFVRAKWDVWTDTHALNPYRPSPDYKEMYFSLSRGGRNGHGPNQPLVYQVRKGRNIVDVTKWSGVNPAARGRGRSALYFHFGQRSSRWVDVIFTNAELKNNVLPHHAFKIFKGGYYNKRRVRGFRSAVKNIYATVTDVNNDGQVEVVSFQALKIFRVIGSFYFKDITSTVLPGPLSEIRSVASVAELDYDNDGKWDLYIARGTTNDLRWLRGLKSGVSDVLLRNVGGTYVDVSDAARIPPDEQSRGVTVGDFNNDGWVDIVVTRHTGQDLLLLNNRDGTFTTRIAGFRRAGNVRGDMATAVDLHRDGRIDIVLSEGDWFDRSRGGYYRIMKNISTKVGRSLLIRVLNAPGRGTTSLHAVATLRTYDGVTMQRRVGSPGTAVSNSYIELLHFGLGFRKSVKYVSVRWVNGKTQTKGGLAAGKVYTFGV